MPSKSAILKHLKKMAHRTLHSPKKSTSFQITRSPINQGDSSGASRPEKTTVIPPRVSNTESVTKEVRNSKIRVNISYMDTNVSMGEPVLNNEAK
ncbi:unnamed protein product [Lactuca saligna]|uniref:Uncharacterized protein n=1 Tax=Lactuca saligna TaxID=75948 RepID=A0AA35ZUC7_LACSI|nr:unnamed protein product [Lactuca saligna]